MEEKLDEEEQLDKRRKAVEATLKHRHFFKDKIDYEKLINDGRER